MVIICEGCDNVGKGTQIEKLKNYFESSGKSVHTIHYAQVELEDDIKKLTPDEIKLAQRIASYSRYCDMINLVNEYAFDKDTVLIFDRAHLGEYVYSPMYRNYDGSYVFDIEKKFLTENAKAYAYELVFVDEPENLIKRDDGLSFSIDLYKKKQEIKSFIEAYDKSIISNKHLININGKDIETVWHEIEEIIND